MKPIAIFFHCLFYGGEPAAVLPSASFIIQQQMRLTQRAGLTEAAAEIVCGINGGSESEAFANSYLPTKATKLYHGLQCRNELRTLLALQEWVKTHPDWHVLYFHSKGASHPPGSDYARNVSKPWRDGMMADLVSNWRNCVSALEAGADISCSHWMWGCADGTQHIPAGNFLWITSNFAATLPSMLLRDRLKVSGIDALESRYEGEVMWGNGKRPTVKSYRPNGGGGVP